MPLVESELTCRREGVPNPNRTASRAWDAFFTSSSLFGLADKLGYIARWLHSGQEFVEDQMTVYLRCHARAHGDRVAELLEPFVGRGGRWADRLRFTMEWVELGDSRRFFDLFLQLLDDGTLDNARGPIAINSTFWSILHGLAEKRPSWCAEVAPHWLDRKLAIARALAAEGNESTPSLDDQFGVNEVLQSARAAPKEFLEHVLPAILRASEEFVHDNEEKFRPDRIWPIRFSSGYLGMTEAFPKGCEIAFESLGSTEPAKLRPFIESLRKSRLCIANHLLQDAYISAPEGYAEEAIALLADEPERLHCGVSGSPFWTARTLVEKCSPYCSEETFRRIEARLLDYKRLRMNAQRMGFDIKATQHMD